MFVGKHTVKMLSTGLDPLNNPYHWGEVDILPSDYLPQNREQRVSSAKKNNRKAIDPSFFDVRGNAICVVGLQREAVLEIKNQIGGLLPTPLPLESFHIRSKSDIKDGALLVPKLVMVATHCPGVKLIDEEGDSGQLDFLYDEAAEIGSDVLLIYVGLPKSIYPKNKHSIYHPKMEEMVFPSSPLLRHLANENCFFTITGDNKMSSMQKNVLIEWLAKPVGSNHPVYAAAEYLSSVELSEYESSYTPKWKGTMGGSVPAVLTFMDEAEGEEGFVPAVEEHPLADKVKKKKKKKEKKRFSFRKQKDKREYQVYENDPDLILMDENPAHSPAIFQQGSMAIETSSSVMF